MKNNRKGFTLIELVVVTLIMGILASLSMPYYNKTVETSKATDAVAMGRMLASAYRMYKIDNPGVELSPGDITNSCNGGSCSTGDTSGCRLVKCSYVAQQDWTNASYTYKVGPAACGNGYVACVKRVNGTNEYVGWGYKFSAAGGCSPEPSTTTPPCPKF
jgi:prepilin-type N-terminal cleavage/methylation domain-containing protein